MPPAAKKGHQRVASEYVEVTRSHSFVHRPGFRWAYAFLVLAAWVTLRMIFFNQPASVIWTITLQAHAVVSFVCFHWVRGSPDLQLGTADPTHGEDSAHLTFWEQLEGGKFFGTPTRRFFTLVPIVIFFLALVWTQDNTTMLLCNAFSTLILLVAKSESLFGVRLFGLNTLQE